jgi:hypothetical protein
MKAARFGMITNVYNLQKMMSGIYKDRLMPIETALPSLIVFVRVIFAAHT